MEVVRVSALVDALADERMLAPEHYEEFTCSMLPVCQDLPILAQELVYRGWLTPFQIEQILADRSDALLLGSYVLLEPLGEGGMGHVFRARNWKLNCEVAIKVIREQQARQPAVATRFQREIRALSRIHHPNIVKAIDAGFQHGSLWFAMEYVRGVDLGRHVRERGPLPIKDACDAIAHAAEALQHAHDCGLVHRDIKPSNLMLREADRSVKLLDLGLTRCEIAIDDSAFRDLTRAGAIIGTPDYMAPEQIRDSRSVDVRSDLYSLGCTFYFLLCGRAPFEDADAVVDKLFMQCEEEPVAIEVMRPEVPAELAQLIRRLMAKRRGDRVQSANELISALDAFRSQLDTGAILAFSCVNSIPFELTSVSGELPKTELMYRDGIDWSHPAEAAPANVETTVTLRADLMRFTIAIVLATIALLLLWQSGRGPGKDRGESAPKTPLGLCTFALPY